MISMANQQRVILFASIAANPLTNQKLSGSRTGARPHADVNLLRLSDPFLDVLAHTEDTVILVTRLHHGKFKVTSKSWEENKVIFPDQAIELRLVAGHKARHPDSGDMPPPVEPIGAEGEIAEFE